MARSAIGVVIVSAVLLAGAALVVLRPQALEKVLPATAITALDQVTGAGTAGKVPADFLQDAPEGLLADGPIAAHGGNRPVFIDAAISGYSTDMGRAVPSEITTIRPILGCILTPPMPGTVVGHATAGDSGLSLALSTYGDTDLAAALRRFVDAYRKTGEAGPIDASGAAYQGYDVAVTETAAPVYLVLESTPGRRIWNLHLAEGARIERVILLGGSQAGVANLDPVVPVEVILDDGLAACGIEPAYAPNPGKAMLQGRTDAAALVQIGDRAAAYDIWFRDSFGVTASASRVGFDRGTLSVIGPLPGETAPKAAFAPLAGSKIKTTQDRYFEIAGQVAEGEDFAARVRAMATSFAFGDLTLLRQGVSF